ncbi:IclR family transcriptional regulator [Cupriavidus sp. L7L]|uniref:IclR family transcriptional regulator n=1 Tax=Cupriavidus sp. L7L TaxID=2546443 RepID=UPI0010549110|nr:IclR family transcriptional regulator [Cupriavidus sp. L7L]TDF67157.1 IclR family transcriptional regulator [Cupriavidus sp. L7L]
MLISGRAMPAPHSSVPALPTPGKDIAPDRMVVEPLARGLAVLAAFDPRQTWVRNYDIALETGLPAATVSRLLHSLVELGYVCHDRKHRRYRLASASLTLGHASIADPGLQRLARAGMQSLTGCGDVCVVLGIRDRLDVMVLETRVSGRPKFDAPLRAGTRLGIASSGMGWALLATLPERERYFLEHNVERKAGCDWPELRRRMAAGISQVRELGFCMSQGEWEPALTCVAAPIRIPYGTPLVLACIGCSADITRARAERELGPRLAGAVQALQAQLGVHG